MKKEFFKYLSLESNIDRCQNSYQLVFIKCFFEIRKTLGKVLVLKMAQEFRSYYLKRIQAGLIPDINIDLPIENIQKTTNGDIWMLIRAQPYKSINKNGFINIISESNGCSCLALNSQLEQEFDGNDYDEILKIVNEKLNFYFSRIDSIEHTEKAKIFQCEVMTSSTPVDNKKKNKRMLSPGERLKRRIIKDFSKKKFIGDIAINDEEYGILLTYFRKKYRQLVNSYTHHLIIDPIFATALVQIGIRFYDGSFWPHVADALEIEKIPANQQNWIGNSFNATLTKSGKLLLQGCEHVNVNTILMHSFVTNNYADELFDFLFAYYKIDLERDLQRNTPEMMQSLVDVMLKNDNSSRTYLIVQQTSDACSVNGRGCKIRLRRFLRLIDDCFWQQKMPEHSTNRLSKQFVQWQSNSDDFKIEYNRFHGGSHLNTGKKSFYSPYIKCDMKNTEFRIVFPAQLINEEVAEDIRWIIHFPNEDTEINADSYRRAVTGYKTEEQYLPLPSINLFDEIKIDLLCGTERIRYFKIVKDEIRFFDKDGDFLRTDSLPKGEAYSFTTANYTPISTAIIDNVRYGDLVMSYFVFQLGDIVRLPSGKPLSVGKKLEEGLLPRGRLENAYAIVENGNAQIYQSIPTILIKLPKSKENGTMIDVNGSRFRLVDRNKDIIDLNDRSGETGYLINLSDLGCDADNVYRIFVDVPNDRTNRCWEFALINGFNFEFEDAPYIFKEKGTILFNNKFKIHSKNKLDRVSGENIFNFELESTNDDLIFSVQSGKFNVMLGFDVPTLKWKFDNEDWHIEKPSEIWHSDFPTEMSFKYPENNLKLSMDEQLFDEENDEEQAVSYTKLKEKNLFECDVTKFKSWFGREETIRNIYLDTSKNHVPFISVVTRSTVVSCLLKYDFDNDLLVGELEIMGKANYYADVEFLGEQIVDKVPIISGKFTAQSAMKSGKYRLTVFEEEEDDTGFGTAAYFQIGEFCQELINPYDLQDKALTINYIKKGIDSVFQIPLGRKYYIGGLTRIDEQDKHCYTGKMLVKSSDGDTVGMFPVNVEFFDLNLLRFTYITFSDDGDELEFLYDNSRKMIVKEPEQGMTHSAQYRRYDSLYPEDYIYVVDFIEGIDINKFKVSLNFSQDYSAPSKYISIWTKESSKSDNVRKPLKHVSALINREDNVMNTSISEMQFSVKTYNCLHRAHLNTAGDILNIGSDGLKKVRNLGMQSAKEVITRMHQLGIAMDMPQYGHFEGTPTDKLNVNID